MQNKIVLKFKKRSISSVLTLLDAEAGGPLLQADVLVVVGVALLEEAGGAMLHGNEGGAQGGELRVGQVPADSTAPTKRDVKQ